MLNNLIINLFNSDRLNTSIEISGHVTGDFYGDPEGVEERDRLL